MSHYNGFNYEELYEFIINFFEEDQSPEGKAASNELLDWWNKYISISNLHPHPILTLTQTRVSTVRCHQSSLIQIHKAGITRSSSSAAPSTLAGYLSFIPFRIGFVAMFI